jgi:hypothetical protein
VTDICHLLKYLPPLKQTVIQYITTPVADLQIFWQKLIEAVSTYPGKTYLSRQLTKVRLMV